MTITLFEAKMIYDKVTCLLLLFSIVLLFSSISRAQEHEEKELGEAPAFQMKRAEEDYSYLQDKENSPYEKDVLDALKYIPFSQSGKVYMTLGGQFRPRFEHFSNRFWLDEEDFNFYSQRLAFHTDLVFGKHIRVFGELYHGYISDEEEFSEYDEMDLFQAFVELKIPLKSQDLVAARLGRQEMALGANRLLGLREGPNIRLSYDMARVIYTHQQTVVNAFYGKEVIPLFEAFDNAFTFFDEDENNPKVWGLYSQFKIKGWQGMNELYYLGFQARVSRFNDVLSKETRHTLGLRRYGKLGKHLRYNSEVVFQFGEIGSSTISAFNIDTDWHYELMQTKWKWSPGLKLEYTSGDRNTDDGKINSFNPMFVNPAFYSLAATVTPVNLMAIHPSIRAHPTKKLEIYAEWAIFWRASREDGLYRPTRFLNRPAEGIRARYIGNQLGFELEYEINRHMGFDLDISYFIAGKFVEESGDEKNILHIAPTLSFRF